MIRIIVLCFSVILAVQYCLCSDFNAVAYESNVFYRRSFPSSRPNTLVITKKNQVQGKEWYSTYRYCFYDKRDYLHVKALLRGERKQTDMYANYVMTVLECIPFTYYGEVVDNIEVLSFRDSDGLVRHKVQHYYMDETDIDYSEIYSDRPVLYIYKDSDESWTTPYKQVN